RHQAALAGQPPPGDVHPGGHRGGHGRGRRQGRRVGPHSGAGPVVVVPAIPVGVVPRVAGPAPVVVLVGPAAAWGRSGVGGRGRRPGRAGDNRSNDLLDGPGDGTGDLAGQGDPESGLQVGQHPGQPLDLVADEPGHGWPPGFRLSALRLDHTWVSAFCSFLRYFRAATSRPALFRASARAARRSSASASGSPAAGSGRSSGGRPFVSLCFTAVLLSWVSSGGPGVSPGPQSVAASAGGTDRKSTRLNSSHANISYA